MSKQENRLSRIKVFCWVIYQLELVTQSKQMRAPLPIGIGNLESVQPPSNLRLVSLLTAINRSHTSIALPQLGTMPSRINSSPVNVFALLRKRGAARIEA